jgi:hypothetical protein
MGSGDDLVQEGLHDEGGQPDHQEEEEVSPNGADYPKVRPNSLRNGFSIPRGSFYMGALTGGAVMFFLL